MTAPGKHQVIAVLEQLMAQWRDGPPADWENHAVPEYLEAMAAQGLGIVALCPFYSCRVGSGGLGGPGGVPGVVACRRL